MTPEEFAGKVPQFNPRIWRSGRKVRVYLTPPGWKRDAGFVDFTGERPTICFAMDSADAATVRAALGR